MWHVTTWKEIHTLFRGCSMSTISSNILLLFSQLSNLTGKITGRWDLNTATAFGKRHRVLLLGAPGEEQKDCLACRTFRCTAVAVPDCYGLPWHGISSLLKTSAASRSNDMWTFPRNKQRHGAQNCKSIKAEENSSGERSRTAEHFIWAW